MSSFFLSFIVFILPAALLAWFVVSLVLLKKTPAENTTRKRSMKAMAIISGILAGINIATVWGFIILLRYAISNM